MRRIDMKGCTVFVSYNGVLDRPMMFTIVDSETLFNLIMLLVHFDYDWVDFRRFEMHSHFRYSLADLKDPEIVNSILREMFAD